MSNEDNVLVNSVANYLTERVLKNSNCINFRCDEKDTFTKKAKITWTESEDSANLMLQEMGLSFLNGDSSNSTSMDSVIGPTPPCSNENLPPSLLSSQNAMFSSQSSGNVSCSSPDSLLNDFSSSLGFQSRRLSTQPTGPDVINILSDEILLTIFSWMPKYTLVKCARVCKRWNALAFEECFWKRLDLSNKCLGPGVLGKVLDRGVTILRLSKAEICSPIYLDFTHASMFYDSVEERFCNVQYLDLSMAVISSKTLEEVLSLCTRLRKFSLENCEVSEQAIAYLGNNLELETLNLCMCTNITTRGLVPLTTNCKKLDALNLAWTDVDRETVAYLMLCLPNSLTKLNISGFRDNLLDEDISRLVRTCPNLKELDLSDGTMLTANCLSEIVANLQGLEYIAMSRCYHILPSSLPDLRRIITLMALDVFGTMREPTLQVLKDEMPGVEVNKYPFSNIARPTTGIRRTSIWGLRVRENIV